MTSRSQKVNLRLPQKRLTLINGNEVKQNHYKNPSGKTSEKQKLKPDASIPQLIQIKSTQASKKPYSKTP